MPMVPFSYEDASSPIRGMESQQASPNDFGANVGAANERVGSEISGAADQNFQVMLQRRQLVSQMRSQAQTAAFMTDTDHKVNGDPSVEGDRGFMGLNGFDAERNRPQMLSDLEKIRQQHLSALKDDPIAAMDFENQTRKIQSYTTNQVGRQARDQYDTAQVGQYQSNIKSAQDSFSANYQDPGKREAAMSAIRSNASSLATFKGMGADYGNQIAASAGSAAALTALVRAKASGGIDSVLPLYQSLKPHMTGEDMAKIEEHIAPDLEDAKASAIAAHLTGQSLPGAASPQAMSFGVPGSPPVELPNLGTAQGGKVAPPTPAQTMAPAGGATNVSASPSDMLSAATDPAVMKLMRDTNNGVGPLAATPASAQGGPPPLLPPAPPGAPASGANNFDIAKLAALNLPVSDKLKRAINSKIEMQQTSFNIGNEDKILSQRTNAMSSIKDAANGDAKVTLGDISLLPVKERDSINQQFALSLHQGDVFNAYKGKPAADIVTAIQAVTGGNAQNPVSQAIAGTADPSTVFPQARQVAERLSALVESSRAGITEGVNKAIEAGKQGQALPPMTPDFEKQIRATYFKDPTGVEANELISRYHSAATVGQADALGKHSTSADVGATLAAIDPNNPQHATAALGGAGGRKSAPGVGEGAPIPGITGGDEFVSAKIAKLNDILKNRKDDAASAVAAQAPEWFKGFTPDTPEFHQRMIAAQQAMGIPSVDQRVLTKPQADSEVMRLNALDPAHADMAKVMTDEQAKYGAAWPTALHDMVKSGLNPGMEGVADMGQDNPATVAYVRAIQKKPGELADTALKMGAMKSDVDGISTPQGAIMQATLAPLLRTINFPGQNNDTAVAKASQQVSTLALSYMGEGPGVTAQQAATRAFGDIFGRRYDFVSGSDVRFPKGQAQEAMDVGHRVQNVLGLNDMVLPANAPQTLRDMKRDDLLASAKNGTWVTSENDQGMTLMMQAGNRLYPVYTQSGRVEVPWDKIGMMSMHPGAAVNPRDMRIYDPSPTNSAAGDTRYPDTVMRSK